MSEAEDGRRLAARCASGEAAAWEILQARHASGMRRAAAARLRAVLPGASEGDAEEVVQRVMTKLAADSGRALLGFDGRARLGTWLVALALREATDFSRAEGRARARALHAGAAEPPEVPSPLQGLVHSEDVARLGKALEGLPGRDRLLLRLIYWETLSYREAARILGVAEGSISPLLDRARSALLAAF